MVEEVATALLDASRRMSMSSSSTDRHAWPIPSTASWGLAASFSFLRKVKIPKRTGWFFFLNGYLSWLPCQQPCWRWLVGHIPDRGQYGFDSPYKLQRSNNWYRYCTVYINNVSKIVEVFVEFSEILCRNRLLISIVEVEPDLIDTVLSAIAQNFKPINVFIWES